MSVNLPTHPDGNYYSIPEMNEILKTIDGSDVTESTVSEMISEALAPVVAAQEDAGTAIEALQAKDTQLQGYINTINGKMATNDASLVLPADIGLYIEPLVGENHSNWGNSYYYKVGTKVHVHLGMKALPNTDGSTANHVYTLPTGYRPREIKFFTGQGQQVSVIKTVTVESNGQIKIYGTTAFCLSDFEYDAF